MGRRNKQNKNRNTRAVHHGRVKNTEQIFDGGLAVHICNKFDKERQKRERLEFLEKSLNLVLERKLSYFVLNKQDIFSKRFHELHLQLFISQLDCENYSEAFESLQIVLEHETSHLRQILEPFKDLFLLRIKGGNKSRTAESLVRKTEQIIVGGETEQPFHVLFIPGALLELSRLQMFDALQYLSCLMLEKMPFGAELLNHSAREFFIFSCIDKLRYTVLDRNTYNHSKAKYALTLCEFPAKSHGEFHLSISLIRFYAVVHGVEDEDSIEEVTKKCIKSMEKYIEHQSTKQNLLCYTCDTESTPNCEVLICQGCRVASYCCRGHQRLNFLFNDKAGTKGLGHKHLCPVFKAYRKKKENIESSKQGHLERKFERACKRFLLSTLKSNASKRMVVNKQNEYQSCDLGKGFDLFIKAFFGFP